MAGVPFADGTAAPVKGGNPFISEDFLVTVGLLVLALAAAAVAFAVADRWRKRQLSSARESTASLTSFREMFENGELTRTEYERIRDRVAAKMKQEVGLAPTPTPSAATPPLNSGDRADGATPANGADSPAGGAQPPPSN